jgi:hypothetical protein
MELWSTGVLEEKNRALECWSFGVMVNEKEQEQGISEAAGLG